MKPILAIAAAVAVAGAAVLPAPVSAQVLMPGTAQPAAVVLMTDSNRFVPQAITIKAGDIVEWRNEDKHVHSVSFLPNRAMEPDNVRLPEGVEPFSSQMIDPGEIYRHRFTEPGFYRYFDLANQKDGMIGEIRVAPRM